MGAFPVGARAASGLVIGQEGRFWPPVSHHRARCDPSARSPRSLLSRAPAADERRRLCARDRLLGRGAGSAARPPPPARRFAARARAGASRVRLSWLLRFFLPSVDRRGLGALGPLLREAGCERVLVICGPGGRHAARLQRELSGVESRVFPEARRHVPQELVERASAAASAFQVDAIVTLGGGSATGLGKGTAARAVVLLRSRLPTTYAGSELTDLYGTTKRRRQTHGRDPRVVPTWPSTTWS